MKALMPCLMAVILVLLIASPLAEAQEVTEAPTLVEPLSDIIVVRKEPIISPTSGVKFRWIDVANEQSYQLQIDFTPLSGSPVSETYQLSANTERFELITFPSGFLSLGTYSWMIRGVSGPAQNPVQTGPWSQQHSFQVFQDDPYRQAPDVVLDASFDYMDLLAFTAQWYLTQDDIQSFNAYADYNKSGRVDEADLPGIMSYIKNGTFAGFPNPVEIVFPPIESGTATNEVALTDIIGGTETAQVKWKRVSGAFRYTIHVSFDSRDEFIYVFASSGDPEILTTSIDTIIDRAALYNIRIAAENRQLIMGEWSVFRHWEVTD
jgi:hypothetical protein